MSKMNVTDMAPTKPTHEIKYSEPTHWRVRAAVAVFDTSGVCVEYRDMPVIDSRGWGRKMIYRQVIRRWPELVCRFLVVTPITELVCPTRGARAQLYKPYAYKVV